MSAALDAGVVCLVPARSGSARLVDKNLQKVGGLSLLERAVRVAVEAFGRVLVSTDSPRYAEIAGGAGADVPALRPAALAAADTPMDAVVQHAVAEWVAETADIFVLVQPTTPFTVVDDLRGVVAALRRRPDAGCALTLAQVTSVHASLMVGDDDGAVHFLDERLAALRTQDVPALGVPTGGAFAARVERLRRGEPLQRAPFLPVWVEASRALDVDDAGDLARARHLAGDPA